MSRGVKVGRSSSTSASATEQGWDPPDQYVNKAVAAAVGTSSNDAALRKSSNVLAPSVTVYTNIAGAVAVTVVQGERDGKSRIRSKLLPENPFNPFRFSRSSSAADKKQIVGTDEAPKESVPQVHEQFDNEHVRSSVAACIAAESIKAEVRKELDKWALQTYVPPVQLALEQRMNETC